MPCTTAHSGRRWSRRTATSIASGASPISESRKNSTSPVAAAAPALRAADGPRLAANATTRHGNSAAIVREPSVLASSTTITSAGARVCAYTAARHARSVLALL
jgi:hypothetical protein